MPDYEVIVLDDDSDYAATHLLRFLRKKEAELMGRFAYLPRRALHRGVLLDLQVAFDDIETILERSVSKKLS